MIDGPRRPSRPSAPPPPPQKPAPRPPVKKLADAYSTGRGRALRAKTMGIAPPPGGGNGVSLSVDGEFTKELKNAKGYGVSFGISANATVVTNQQTKDGVTSYSVQTDASVTLSGGVSTPQAGVSVAHTEGVKASYEVKMPADSGNVCVDPRSVNPFDPASMPVGSIVTLDGSHYSSNEFKATFKNLAIATKITDENGVSVAVEKTGANTVRVTAGPTEAIEAYNGVGVDVGVASVMLGRNDRLASATLKTAEFDLSTAAGKAAYNDFLASGTLPKDNGTGISHVATIEKIDYSSQSELGVSVGPIDVSFGGAKNTGARVVTTLPDGTQSVSVDLQYSGNVPMNVTEKFDANGKEILSERRYTYSLKADKNNAQLLNVAITGDVQHADDGPVKPGKTVTMQFTEDQMRQYMQMTQRASGAGMGMNDLDVLVEDYDGKFINNTEDFALSLGRNLGGGDYGQAERMFTISDASDGKYDDHFTKIPGTFVVS